VKVVHAHGVLEVDRPLLMGVVNASPESFSDSEALAAAGTAGRVAHALAMAEAGAHVVDIGGQSARTDRPEIPVELEIERVATLIGAIRQSSDVVISVDTYRPDVARAAVDAGASIVNDVSGLADPDLIDVVASSGAGLIVMHTRLPPKTRLSPDDAFYAFAEEVVEDVVSFLAGRLDELEHRGVPRERVVVDPGPDFAKTPAQTVAALRGLPELARLGRPILLALSRKDVIGAITGQPPRARAAGTLAAIGYCVGLAPHSLLRVHDVEATRDYLAVLAALQGEHDLEWDRPLEDRLRYDRP
jgi:dihydropteroate synthase